MGIRSGFDGHGGGVKDLKLEDGQQKMSGPGLRCCGLRCRQGSN